MVVITRFRAFAVGCAVLAVLDALWILVLLDVPGAAVIRVGLMLSPAIAAFLTACLAPSGGFLLGAAQGTSAALLSIISMSIYENFGFRHDKIGGPAETFIILWLWCTALSIVGGALAIIFKVVSEFALRRNLMNKRFSAAYFRLIGLLFITFFTLAVGFLGSVGDYVYERLGTSRDVALLWLWLIPAIVGGLSAFSSERHKFLSLGLLVLFLCISGVLAHGLGWSGVPKGFNVSTLNVAFQYLVSGTMVIGLGWVMGFALSRRRGLDGGK